MSVQESFSRDISHITYITISAGRSFGRWSVGHTVSRLGVEAEELGTHSLILEAGIRSPISAALGVKREQGSWQRSTQGAVLVRGVVQAGGRVSTKNQSAAISTFRNRPETSSSLEEVVEALHRAGGPSEAPLRVTQIGHDVAILPATPLGARSAQVAGRWRTVVHRSQPEKRAWDTL